MLHARYILFHSCREYLKIENLFQYFVIFILLRKIYIELLYCSFICSSMWNYFYTRFISFKNYPRPSSELTLFQNTLESEKYSTDYRSYFGFQEFYFYCLP